MADVARLNLTERAAEARLRSLLEDVVEFHVDVYPNNRLALAVWFGKSHGDEQHLLELFKGVPKTSFATAKFSLLWKTGSNSPPTVEIRATSVEYFSDQLAANSPELTAFFDRAKVLYFDKALLTDSILRAFSIVTEPPGFAKGWYVEADRAKGKAIRELLSSYEAFQHLRHRFP